MSLLLAALPILCSSLMILVWRQSAVRAGLAGLFLTGLIVLFRGDFQVQLPVALQAVSTGFLNTLNVAYVLLGGVFFYRVLSTGGALEVIASEVMRWIPDEVHRLFAIVFGVSVFFESATGFGVGILVSAPLFIALGYKPVQAAVIALLGQCVVPWGALAIGTVIGSELSGVSIVRLAELAAYICLPFVVICGAAALKVAEQKWHRRQITWLIVYSLLLCVALWVLSVTVAVELAGCLAGMLIVGFAMLVNRLQHRKISVRTTSGAGVVSALFPFCVLMVALLVTRLYRPLRSWLESITFEVGDFTLAPFYHVGFWLVVAGLAGLLVLAAARQQAGSIINAAVPQWFIATVAVGGFLLFGQLMMASGMTALMAQSLANVVGPYYAAVVPLLGGLGGFLTASNTSSNALFMGFQVSAAQQVGMPVDVAAAVQNAAGSNTTLASPGRVIFAASVAGYPGAESDLLRRVLPVALAGVASAILISLLLESIYRVAV